jgi:hypothetical protein
MVLLISLVMGLEKVNRWQIIGMIIALSGAVLVITRGQASGEHGLTQGDLLVLCAMLAWAGYTLVQNRVSAGIGFLARIGLFAAFGALFALPFALYETWSDPAAVLSFKAAKVYLFAGLVPGLYCLCRVFVLWLGVWRALDIAQRVSRPRGRRGALDHLPGRGADVHSSGRRRAVAWRHVAEPAPQSRQAGAGRPMTGGGPA